MTGYTEGNLDGNSSAGEYDIFLTKYDSNGTKIWTKQWGTSSSDYGYGVAIDSADNIYMTGYTEGNLDDNSSAENSDIFLLRSNPNP